MESNIIETNVDLNENIDIDNNFENEKLNESIINTLKKAKIVIIVGWPLLLLFVGFYVVAVASVIVGIQFIRKQQIKKGVLLWIFGALTLGIWPFIAANKEIKNQEVTTITHNPESEIFKKSLLKAFNASRILLFVAVPLITVSLALIILGGIGSLFIAMWTLSGGFAVAMAAAYVISTQDFRRDKLSHGVCIMMFGWASLGIWPLIYTLKQRKILMDSIQEN